MVKSKLKLIAFDNCIELGKKVDKYLQKELQTKKTNLVKVNCTRFANGEGKSYIDESISDKDLYILSDIGNYNIKYDLYGQTHNMSPDEHFQDIKRVISAANGRFRKITVIMPLLYQSRQHRRRERESLDCALALQELENIGVNKIITFDCHDPNVSNAIPNLPFENYFASDLILKKIEKDYDIKNDKSIIISPDMGAMERARYYAEKIKCDVGLFYKRRDLTKVINGKNPIVEHAYLGKSAKGIIAIVIDDMIASGGSMIDVAKKLKEQGATKVILVSTFSLFTAGIEKFVEAYDNKIFDKLYTTNLTYIPEDFKKYDWLKIVDCSKQIAEIIYGDNTGAKITVVDDEDVNHSN
ncbi:MAG: ribose-phosphate diphosphokinase [Bacilli bacterium]|nr:ribose-phosphate diphosphokinase [Bacilli bacterium]